MFHSHVQCSASPPFGQQGGLLGKSYREFFRVFTSNFSSNTGSLMAYEWV